MRLLPIMITFTICQMSLAQQGLYISTEGSISNDNSRITIVDGDFISLASTGLNGGTLQMKGLDGNTHDIILKNPSSVDYLELYGAASFQLDGSLILNMEVLFSDTASFTMKANSHVTLGPNAEIVGESNLNTITGADGTYIKTTRNHTAGTTNDFGLIGLVTYNGSTDMGNTEVYRRYHTFSIAGNPTTKRYYEINPDVNSGLDIDAHFYLSNIDLNGLDRSTLAAFRSLDGGTTFTNEQGTPTMSFHAVSHIDAFSIWAFTDASTLSIDTSDLAHSISIFPNPAKHTVNITTAFGNVINSIMLFDVNGQGITTRLLENNTIDIRNLSDGIYFIKITSQQGIVTKKLIVRR